MPIHGIKRLEMSRELPRLHFIFVAFTALGGADYFGRINFMHLSGECRRAVESESEYDRERAQFELPNFHGEFSASLRAAVAATNLVMQSRLESKPRLS